MSLVDTENLGLFQRAYVRFADGHAHWPGIVPIEGGPAWIRSDLYRINAQAAGSPSPEMMEGPMMQALLEERFKLKLHRETREVPVYTLTAARGGSRLKPFEEGSCIAMPLSFPMAALAPGQKHCKVRAALQRPMVDAEGSTVAEFSQLLHLVLDRPVIDKTGIAGKYKFHLEFAINSATPRYLPGGDLARFSDAAAAAATPSIFDAIAQLGLKLEASTGPRDFFVVDHVEKPNEN